jgi:hypothetical protein
VPSKQRTSVRWVREPAGGIILMHSLESCIFVKMDVCQGADVNKASLSLNICMIHLHPAIDVTVWPKYH